MATRVNGEAEEPSPGHTAQPPTEVRETRQFGIGGLLWFTLLCALWFPQPMIFKGIWESPQGGFIVSEAATTRTGHKTPRLTTC